MAGKIHKLLPKELIKEIYRYIPEKCRFRWVQYESGFNPVYVEERNQRICQKRLQNITVKEIAAEENLSMMHVNRILKDNGIQVQEEKTKSRKELLKEYLGKYNKKKIAEMLGISRQRLYQIMKEEEL